jgi:lipid-A-disaccharide synthase
MLVAAERLRESDPGVRFVLPAASTLPPGSVREAVGTRLAESLLVVEGAFADAVGACDAAAVASGTATLEVGLRDVPQVIVYRTSPLTYLLGRRLVRVPHVGLVNLVAGREIAPELLQGDFTPERLAAELRRLLGDGEARAAARDAMRQVRGRLRGQGAYRRAAEVLVSMLRGDMTRATLDEVEGA